MQAQTSWYDTLSYAMRLTQQEANLGSLHHILRHLGIFISSSTAEGAEEVRQVGRDSCCREQQH